MSLTAKRADKLASLAINVTYAANDVADNLSDLRDRDRYLTKAEREELVSEARESFMVLYNSFHDLRSSLKKWGVI